MQGHAYAVCKHAKCIQLPQCRYAWLLAPRSLLSRAKSAPATVTKLPVPLQQTIIPPTSSNPFRIDLQTNGAFDKTFYDENKQPYVVSCYQVAVQAGSDVYAAVLVPAGQFVSAGGVRKALYNSFEQSAVGSFVKPPRKFTGAYTWLIAIGGVFLFVLNG